MSVQLANKNGRLLSERTLSSASAKRPTALVANLMLAAMCAACSVDVDGNANHEGTTSAMTGTREDVGTALLRVTLPLASDEALVGYREHVALDDAAMVKLGVDVGAQVRIGTSHGEFALYTVVRALSGRSGTLQMGLVARNRLGVKAGDSVEVAPFRPDAALTDEEAEARGAFVERTVVGTSGDVIVIAPHGGAIESNTDLQADVARRAIGSGASSWVGRGWNSGGKAFDRWHVRSADIHVDNFPMLKVLASRPFARAISFHGYSGDEVLIGGGADATLKEQVRAAVEHELAGTGIAVRVTNPGDKYDGDSAANIVNRLAKDGAGIQIEQPLTARLKYGARIATAVARVVRGA